MDKRENLIRAIRRTGPESVPFGLSLCPSLEETFKSKTGQQDYMEYFDLPYRILSINPTKNPPDYSRYFSNLSDDAYIDEWGIGHIRGHVEHFTRFIHSMGSFTTPEQVWEYPLPDVLEDYRWEGVEKKVQDIKNLGLAAIFYSVQIFEPAWYLRGMENLLADMMIDEDMASACLDRMTDIKVKMCEKIAASGVDIIVYGDDVGTQKDMMMSPDLWRKWLKPTIRKAIEAAKSINPDLIAYYHSDGVIYDVIPDLIEIGVDVLNPIQPECMDPIKVKEMYGDSLSFWGTIGTQTTMPFGTTEEVDRQVKLMIEGVGKGGGLVIAPTHLLEPEVPYENIEAFVDAVRKYSKY